MILGTQWYILFNVIAGASAIPQDMKDAAGNLGLTGWLRWRRFILPAIFPAYVTGAITASGGSWNASIVSELVTWGDTTLEAAGLGAYIAKATDGRRLPAHRAGHRRAVPVRPGLQPAAVAAALRARRRAPAPRLRERRDDTMTGHRHRPARPQGRQQDLSATPDRTERLVLENVDFRAGRGRDRRHARQVGLGQVDAFCASSPA